MLEHARRRPQEFADLARDLFGAMANGGRVGFEPVAWFNGGLFDDASASPQRSGRGRNATASMTSTNTPGTGIYLCPAQFFAARFRPVRPRPFPLIQRSQVAWRACWGCLGGRPDIIVALKQRQVRTKIFVANRHALDDSAWPESSSVTYEAPPDNDHKVVRLHGTTESLP